MENQIAFRPLYLAERLTEEMGTPVSYVYEDLVFIEHGDVLLQFDDEKPDAINIYVNNELHSEDEEMVVERWMQVALTKNVRLVRKGRFSIEQIPGVEEISITFHD